MITILFVCSGDTCRSTMASAILKNRIEKQNLSMISCSSAGINVVNRLPMNANAQFVMNEWGINIPKHFSTKLTSRLIKSFDYVLTMTEQQKNIVLMKYKDCMNVYSIHEFVGVEDVEDPYGKGCQVYFNCANRLFDIVEKIIKKLKIEEAS